MDKRPVLRNIRSNQIIDGAPKLPTAEQILHGEIAINFAKNHETLSLKNDKEEIVALELRSVSNLDGKLDAEIKRAQLAEQANAKAIETEEARATSKENEISGLLGTKSDTKETDTAFGRISKEINDRENAINSLDSTVGSTSVSEGKHVAVQVVEENGKLTSLTVTESDIASAKNLSDEITRATNSENNIKGSYLKNINVNGIDGEFSNNVSKLTVKGKDILLSNEYTVVEYPSSFNNRASHVNASDTIDSAFHHVESTIKTLSEDIITNELTTANSISSLAEVVGVMTVDDAIVYEKNTNTNYLSEASSVHHATLLLDNKIKELEEKTNNVEIKDVKVNGNSVVAADKTAYINLSATNIPITTETNETSTIYSELNSIKNDCSRIENALQNKTNDLTNKIIEDELISANSINALVEASGLVSSNNEITYTKKANPYYIGEASSLSDAINILDENLNIVQKLIETSVKKAITDLIKANPSLNMNNPFEMPNT